MTVAILATGLRDAAPPLVWHVGDVLRWRGLQRVQAARWTDYRPSRFDEHVSEAAREGER